MLPTGVEFNMDTLLMEQLGWSTTRSCLYQKESTQGLSPVAFELAGADFQLQQEKGAMPVLVGEEGESQTTPSFIRENVLVYLLPPFPACFYVLAP